MLIRPQRRNGREAEEQEKNTEEGARDHKMKA